MTVLATRRCVSVALITVIWMFWLALFPAMLFPALYAQQIDPEHGAKGFFVAGMDQKIGGADPGPASRQQALVMAGRLRDILQRDTAVSSPTGYSVRVNRGFGKVTDWAKFDSGLPFYAAAFGTFFSASEKPSPTHFSSASFGVYANTVLGCPLMEFTPPGASGKPMQVNGNPVVQGGRRTGQFRGFPVYDGQCAILGRSGKPAFIPVTRRQYMQFEIGMLKEKLDGMNKQYAGQTVDPAVRDAINSASKQLSQGIQQKQQELASMSPQDAAAPAAVQTGYGEAKLVDIKEEGATPLSIPNPAFFDRSLPADTVQSVEVYIPFLDSAERRAGLPAGLTTDWQAACEKIRDQLDWAALAAMVH